MVAQYRVFWDTAGGGRGFSILHFNEPESSVEAQNIAGVVGEVYTTWAATMPNNNVLTFDTEVLVMSDAGELLNTFPVEPHAAVVGSSANEFARAAGARVDWATNDIVAGRRVRGRTFIVPIASSGFDAEGLLDDSTVNQLGVGALQLITDAEDTPAFVIWSRTHSSTHGVVGFSVPLRGAVLRGRRD